MSARPHTAASIYRFMGAQQIGETIERLERTVRQLTAEAKSPRLIEDYRRALDLARAELERRSV